MYARLIRHLPLALANAVAVLWYAALIVIVYALWSAPQAAFRYVQL